MSLDLWDKEDIKGLAPVVGWLVIVNGLRAMWDTDGPRLFTGYQEAQRARGWLDTCEPATAADVERWRRQFDRLNPRKG